jgi:hypothetical protein
MLETVQDRFEIARHRQVISAIDVVPFHSDVTVKDVGPISSIFTIFFGCCLEVLCMLVSL